MTPNTGIGVERETELGACRPSEGVWLSASKGVTMRTSGGVGGSSVVEVDKSLALSFAFLPAIVGLGVEAVGCESGRERCYPCKLPGFWVVQTHCNVTGCD